MSATSYFLGHAIYRPTLLLLRWSRWVRWVASISSVAIAVV